MVSNYLKQLHVYNIIWYKSTLLKKKQMSSITVIDQSVPNMNIFGFYMAIGYQCIT